MSETPERHEFQTEVRQLLDLMIHSLYSHKEVFLRELISNASDALDKRRFEALTRPELAPADELAIHLEADAAARTLTVSDNGIGMSREEVVQNIGTIARSGTGEFLAALRERAGQAVPPELIGRFGVGFYSSFMVADRITVLSRRAGEATATRWESGGDGYTIEEAERDARGDQRDAAPQARRRRGRARGLHAGARPARDRQEVLGLRGLSDPAGDRHAELDEGDLDPSQGRGHRGGVSRVLQARLARLERPARAPLHPRRGQPRGAGAALHPVEGALRSLARRRPERGAALRAARVHHGRLQGAAAALAPLRPRRRRLRRPVAQRVARDPPAEPPDPGHPPASRPPPARRPQGDEGRAAREVPDVLERVRPRAQGGAPRDGRRPGADPRAGAGAVDATARSCPRRSASTSRG